MKRVIKNEKGPELRSGMLSGYMLRERNYHVWRPNGTQDWLGIYTVSGYGRFGFDGGELGARIGDFVLVKPGVRHDYGLPERIGRWEILWVHFLPEPAWIDWLQWAEAAPGLMKVSLAKGRARQEMQNDLKEMHRNAITKTAFGPKLAMNALERALLRCASLVWENAGRVDKRATTAQEYLAENLMKVFSLDETARHVGLSSSRLAHLFRQEIGETPRGYHERLKMERAAELLSRTGQSVSEIAYGLGFESVFYFSRRFKQAQGMSPRAYRGSAVVR